MKAEMLKAGEITISPESPTDEYILQQWCKENAKLEDGRLVIKSNNLIIKLLTESEK